MKSLLPGALTTLLLLTTACRRPEPVTFSGELRRLTDPGLLCQAPEGQSSMVSSYDRTGGNEDHRNFQGVEKDGSYILADLKGPGCLTRFWFTGIPDTTRFNLYFDNEPDPRLSLTVMEMKSGASYPFLSPLCATLSGAVISYVPLPYAKRLKITASPDKEGHYYYQLNYTRYPAQTPATSFPAAPEAELLPIQEAVKIWEKPESLYTLRLDQSVHLDIGPGEETALFSSDQPGLIQEWALALSNTSNRLPSMLILNMYWDDMQKPSVQVPLGDFFLNPLRPRSLCSIPIARMDNTYRSLIPMPFRKGARITLSNRSRQTATVHFNARTTPLPDEPPFYFHAARSQSAYNRQRFELPPINGNGFFIGTSLLEYATGNPSWNILEGDELFVVDNARSSAFYGTGLEDYFNGGWYYCDGTYLAPLSGVPERSAIKTAQYRWHLDAPIRFKKQFRGSFEFGHDNASTGFFSATAYWYQKKPAAVPSPGNLNRPADPLEQMAFMCELFETERRQRTDEAIALCKEYVEKFPRTPEAEMLLLRSQAYTLYESGTLPAPLTATLPECNKQADLLDKFYATTNAALVCANINGAYTLYLDGKPLLRGSSMIEQQAALTRLTPGLHTLLLKVSWTHPDNWINVHLRTHTTNLWSDLSWECAQQPDTTEWQPCVYRGVLPKMSWVRFAPNAMVYTQHHPLTGPQPGWDAPGKTCYFRKTFGIPESE